MSHIFLRKICYVEHYIEHSLLEHYIEHSALPVLAAICNTHTSHLGVCIQRGIVRKKLHDTEIINMNPKDTSE